MTENLTLNVNMENLTSEEKETLLAIIAKANEHKRKLWKPKNDETYYAILCDGTVADFCNYSYQHSEMKNSFSIGNCFRTREEAEFAVERLKVIQALREFATEEIIEDGVYFILMCSSSDELRTWQTRRKYSSLRFATEEDANKAIETVGADRIKKYYFNIK